MTSATRIILILTLVLPIAGELSAQPAATATETSDATSTVVETATAEEAITPQRSLKVQEDFGKLLGQHPREVTRILALDPTLLSNEPFLGRYPELADFLRQHPEIRRNPHYYLRNYEVTEEIRHSGPFEDAIETLSILSVFVLIAFALGWLVRTIIEQKRWNQLSRRQSEVHSRILDRFATSEELLEYIKSAAGTKFLESAPIAVRAEQAAPNAPLTRIMWSIQLGVVIATGGLGLLLVSLGFDAETARDLFAMGIIAFSVGAGFIASAVVSVFVSRRLGLWQGPGATAFDDSGRAR